MTIALPLIDFTWNVSPGLRETRRRYTNIKKNILQYTLWQRVACTTSVTNLMIKRNLSVPCGIDLAIDLEQ